MNSRSRQRVANPLDSGLSSNIEEPLSDRVLDCVKELLVKQTEFSIAFKNHLSSKLNSGLWPILPLFASSRKNMSGSVLRLQSDQTKTSSEDGDSMRTRQSTVSQI